MPIVNAGRRDSSSVARLRSHGCDVFTVSWSEALPSGFRPPIFNWLAGERAVSVVCPNATQLILDELVNLQDLSELSVESESDASLDLRTLRSNQLLRWLSLDGVKCDMSQVAKLQRLQLLALHRMNVSDLEFIIGMPSLSKLACEELPVSDLGPIGAKTNLDALYLRLCPVSDLTEVAKLTRLKRIDLMAVPVSDLGPISSCTELEYGAFANLPCSDFRPLLACKRLKELSIIGIDLGDFSYLSELVELEYLTIGPLTQSAAVKFATEAIRMALPSCRIHITIN